MTTTTDSIREFQGAFRPVPLRSLAGIPVPRYFVGACEVGGFEVTDSAEPDPRKARRALCAGEADAMHLRDGMNRRADAASDDAPDESPAEIPVPASGMTLVKEWDAHGARCEVYALPRANWLVAQYEWRVHFAGGGWDGGRTAGEYAAVDQAQNAARIRWENERAAQAAWIEGQAEGENCEN